MARTEFGSFAELKRVFRSVDKVGKFTVFDIAGNILDEVGEDEKHTMAELADAISVFIEKYEAEHVPIPAAKPTVALKFLMRSTTCGNRTCRRSAARAWCPRY